MNCLEIRIQQGILRLLAFKTTRNIHAFPTSKIFTPEISEMLSIMLHIIDNSLYTLKPGMVSFSLRGYGPPPKSFVFVPHA